MSRYRVTTGTLSIFLVLVIVVSSFSWKPREAVDQGLVYSGSLWRGIIPRVPVLQGVERETILREDEEKR
jgi:hypothetical protein